MTVPPRVTRILYRQVAGALKRLLSADALRKGGVSLKSLTLAPNVALKKATHRLTCQTLRYLPVLKEVIAATDILNNAKVQVQEELVYVLVYDLLFGQDLVPCGAAERAVLLYKNTLKAALVRLLVKSRVMSVEELLPADNVTAGVDRPRFVRVNTLKLSVEDALRQLQRDKAVMKVAIDELIPTLLVLPSGTDLHDHPLVLDGSLILQGKASCIPAQVLAPDPSWQVVDACAAPGNKTTQLAALMEGKGNVFACELDKTRIKRLRHMVELTGASNVTVRHQDFLAFATNSSIGKKVKAVLLDPSCSGSGTKSQRLDHLMPSASEGGEDPEEKERIEQLAGFQETALRHALSFPAVERVVYSTCSIHERENEEVVLAVQDFAEERGLSLSPVLPQWPHRGHPLFEKANFLLRTDSTRDGTDGFFVALFTRKKSSGGPDQNQTNKKKKKRQRSEDGDERASGEEGHSNYEGADLTIQELPVDTSETNQSDKETGTCMSVKRAGILRRRRLKRQRKREIESETASVGL